MFGSRAFRAASIRSVNKTLSTESHLAEWCFIVGITQLYYNHGIKVTPVKSEYFAMNKASKVASSIRCNILNIYLNTF